MSLTNEIVRELHSLPINKSCCQKAFLCGLLFGCRWGEADGAYVSLLYRKEDALRAAQIMDMRFSSGKPARVSPSTRGGHRCFAVGVHSKALRAIFVSLDERDSPDLREAVGFRCAECERNFLSGVFISCATLSQPKSGYHLEFAIPNQSRASALSGLLGESMSTPSSIVRGNRVGLYYKSNSKISDLLYVIGAAKASFLLTNFSIERDIRNNENRATNCVTSNISRSVDATRKQIDAINLLIKKQRLSALGEELEYTARLRLAHDSATLSELALLHQPPITKSGLNGRLRRILEAASELDKA